MIWPFSRVIAGEEPLMGTAVGAPELVVAVDEVMTGVVELRVVLAKVEVANVDGVVDAEVTAGRDVEGTVVVVVRVVDDIIVVVPDGVSIITPPVPDDGNTIVAESVE